MPRAKTFYEKLLSSPQYQDAVKDKKLTTREQAIINAICSFGEAQTSDLKLKHTRAVSQTEQQKLKTNIALIWNNSGNPVFGVARILATPLDELASDPDQARPKQIAPPAKSNGEQKNTPSEIIEAEFVQEEAVKKLPFFLLWPAILFENTIARMSPLVIGIWIALIFFGATTFAAITVQRAQASTESVKQQRDDFKRLFDESVISIKGKNERIAELETTARTIQQKEATIESLRGEVVGLEGQIQKERGEHEARMAEAEGRFKSERTRFTADLQEATRLALEELRRQVQSLESQKVTADQKISDLELELTDARKTTGSTNDELEDARQTRDQFKADLRAESQRNTTLQSENSQYRAILPFTQDLVKLADQHFFGTANNRMQLWELRKCFRWSYESLYDIHAPTLERIEVQRELAGQIYSMSNKDRERCNSKIY